MRRSWLVAAALGLVFSVLASYQADNGLLLFLTVAPLLPVAGVAFGYGRTVDPTYEIGLAAPMNGFRLLLLRAVAVLATTMALAGVAALALPQLDWRAAAWLLPAVCLTTVSLALATAVSAERAGALVAAAWLAAVLVSEDRSSAALAAFRAPAQLTFVVLALLATVVLVRRQRALDLLEVHDEWQIAERRYLSEGSMAKLYENDNDGAETKEVGANTKEVLAG